MDTKRARGKCIANALVCQLCLIFLLHSANTEIRAVIITLYTVWVKKIPPPIFFWHFFQNGWEFLVQILHPYYTFLSMLDYKFLSHYRSLTVTKLCYIKRDHHYMLKMSSSKCPPSVETQAGWSHLNSSCSSSSSSVYLGRNTENTTYQQLKTCAPRVRKATTALTTAHKGGGMMKKN